MGEDRGQKRRKWRREKEGRGGEEEGEGENTGRRGGEQERRGGERRTEAERGSRGEKIL